MSTFELFVASLTDIPCLSHSLQPGQYDAPAINNNASSGGAVPDVAALPRSLGMVTFLPALRSLKAPSTEWLRTFFADLRPQQRHVSAGA